MRAPATTGASWWRSTPCRRSSPHCRRRCRAPTTSTATWPRRGAPAEATHSQQAVERERERLAIILARLSTGVLAIDRSMTVRTANEAAGAILGTDLSAASGRALPELAAGNERLGQFV